MPKNASRNVHASLVRILVTIRTGFTDYLTVVLLCETVRTCAMQRNNRVFADIVFQLCTFTERILCNIV